MEAGLDKTSHDLLQRLVRSMDKGNNTLQEAVKQVGIEASEQMAHNLGGESVQWSGGDFIVNVQTGNLRRHTRMDYPYRGDKYSVFVSNDAEYALEIESGITGETKKAKILNSGKRAKTNKDGRKYKRIPGKPGSLIPFWTLTEDSDLADQAPRPFAEATADQMRPRAIELLGDAIMETLGAN